MNHRDPEQNPQQDPAGKSPEHVDVDDIRAKLNERGTRQLLSRLSSRELKDIGLARSDFDALGDGSYFSDPTRYVRSRERLRKCA